MPAGGSCLLGSINLAEYVKNEYTIKSYFDYTSFNNDIITCIFALNEVLEEGLEKHPLKEQRDSVKNWRQIGLGVMGLADALIKLEIPYGSKEAEETIDTIGNNMAIFSIIASAMLAENKEPYRKYSEKVLESEFFKNHITDPELINFIKEHGLRNSQLLTCAPTGSIATMLGISNGIEPLFAKSWKRKTESLHGEDVYYEQYPAIVEEAVKKIGLPLEELDELIVTAHDLKPIQRIRMQAVLQKHIDASISSTINLPYEATIEDVKDIYINAWKEGLKGVTIYREGSKKGGILTTEKNNNKNSENTTFVKTKELKRGEVLPVNDNDAIGFKRKLMTGCGSLHCTAFFDVNTGELVETYLSKGSTGGCNNFMVGLSRMISMASRAGVSIQDIVDQLMSTGSCPSYAARSATKHDTSRGSCCPMAVGYALKEMWEEFQGKEMKPKEIKTIYATNNKGNKILEFNFVACPECGEPLTFEGGCNICKNCGYTKCD